jgi:hypothetical protein
LHKTAMWTTCSRQYRCSISVRQKCSQAAVAGPGKDAEEMMNPKL